MELEQIDIINHNKLTELIPLEINIENFNHITEIIRIALNRLKINTEDLSIIYQRHTDGTSILAIKVCNGDNNDLENYMFNGCNVDYYQDSLSCDVYLHAKSKASKNSVNLSNLISKEIINFFEEVEKELLKKDLKNLELYVKIPLNNQAKRKEKGIKRLIRSLLKK